jgi:hypothetical protein
MLVTQAAWVLLVAFVLSLVYELYRAYGKTGTSLHDSPAAFAKNNIAFYLVAAVVIGVLFAGFGWAAWLGLVFSVAVIVAAIVWYNPKVIVERRPGFFDWFEDVVFTGLLFVAGALLLYSILGVTLEP